MNDLLRELARIERISNSETVSKNPNSSDGTSGGSMSFTPNGLAQKIIESSIVTYAADAAIKGLSLNFVAPEARNPLRLVNRQPDEVFIDHRRADCFSEIKSQGR